MGRSLRDTIPYLAIVYILYTICAFGTMQYSLLVEKRLMGPKSEPLLRPALNPKTYIKLHWADTNKDGRLGTDEEIKSFFTERGSDS